MAKFLVPDDLWAVIAPLLPPVRVRPKGGRPPIPDRAALTGILFVLRTGLPWEYLPQEMGCGSGMSCWRRLRDWQRAGVWAALHRALLERLDGAGRLNWSRAALDSASLPAKNVWPAPSASSFGSAGLSSLHKRIRPFGDAVGQDGDPRVLVLIKGSASSAIFRRRLTEHRSTVRPSSSHRSQTLEGRRRLRRPSSVQAATAAGS